MQIISTFISGGLKKTKCGKILLVRLHLKLKSFPKSLRPMHTFENNLKIILLMQADVGSMKARFTNVSILFQF